MDKPPDALEHSIARLLGAQPPLHAPQSLQRRVLAEIERRAAVPWWKQAFRRWPAPARMALILASLGAVKGVLDISAWLLGRRPGVAIPETIAQPMTSLKTAVEIVESIQAAATTVLHSLPAYWVYELGFAAAASYAALLGLGTVAYRTLHK